MSEIHRSEIIYEEGWRENAPVTEAEESVPVDETEAAAAGDTTSVSPRPLLISLQLILCLLAVLVLFLLKTMDSDSYHDFMDLYHEELSKPVVSQGVFDSLALSRLFDEDAVTIQATPDEAASR